MPIRARTPLARWSPALRQLPALSIRQPWAWLIVNDFKDIENRPRRTNYRGPVLVHAGLSLEAYTEENLKWIKKTFKVEVPGILDTGGIVGVVEIKDCVEDHPSKWFEPGGFGYVLENPRRLPFRPCKGQLGFFRPRFTK